MNIINLLRTKKIWIYHIELVFGIDKFGMLYLLRTNKLYIERSKAMKSLEEEINIEKTDSIDLDEDDDQLKDMTNKK